MSTETGPLAGLLGADGAPGAHAVDTTAITPITATARLNVETLIWTHHLLIRGPPVGDRSGSVA